MRTRRARPLGAQLALNLAAGTDTEAETVRRPAALELSDADHRAIARYVVAMLREERSSPREVPAAAVPAGAQYVRAEQLMARYQISMKFIRRHAVELGATRLSDATNSKLRYHLSTADAFIASHRKHPEPSPRAADRRRAALRTHTPNGAPLVPFT
jgi:hypothetical protein